MKDTPRVTVSAQYLEPGQGGISRVARLTVKALSQVASVRALAVEDRSSQEIGGIHSVPFHGNRFRFLMANGREMLQRRHIIYDFPGTARAHIGSFLGSRYAVWIHGYEIWSMIRPDYIEIVKAADIVLVNSRYTLDRSQSCIGPLSRARVCWLATEEDQVPAVRPLQNGPPTLLFIGRSDDLFGKGQDLLIETWPKVVSILPDARLVFVGGGSELHRLRTLVRNSPVWDNIDALGFLPEKSVAMLWAHATAFAMLGCYEGFGLVFAEAMRYGVPVIASTDDASCEVNVDGVTGFNVSRSDKSGLTDRILFLLSNRDRAAEYGRAGQARWLEHFRFSSFQKRIQSDILPWLGLVHA
jgi:phosphatidylinositol alpha-1,6-mannosyltransferase